METEEEEAGNEETQEVEEERASPKTNPSVGGPD